MTYTGVCHLFKMTMSQLTIKKKWPDSYSMFSIEKQARHTAWYRPSVFNQGSLLSANSDWHTPVQKECIPPYTASGSHFLKRGIASWLARALFQGVPTLLTKEPFGPCGSSRVPSFSDKYTRFHISSLRNVQLTSFICSNFTGVRDNCKGRVDFRRSRAQNN